MTDGAALFAAAM